MTSLSLLDRPCTIRYWAPGPAPELDNIPSDTWTEVDTICSFQQRGRSEDDLLGNLSTTDWLVVLRPEVTPPRSNDEIVVGGVTYQFRGNAYPAYVRGHLDHVEATARADGTVAA